MSLPWPRSLYSQSSRVLATGRCLPRAPQRTSLRSSINTTSSHAERQKGIFDREAELEQLSILQRSCPSDVIVVLGPKSCGKTAVLQEHFIKQADAVYVNCRTIDATTPEGLIEVLLSKLAAKVPVDLQSNAEAALKKVPGVLAGLLSSMKITEKDAALSTVSITVLDLVKAFLGSKERQKNLNAVYDALSELLTVMEKSRADGGSQWPVIIIDEANKLMNWTDRYPDQLDSFLSNLVALSKEGRRCHVILATSEYAFQAWLNNAMGTEVWTGEVIGDFSQADARGFLRQEMQRQAGNALLDDQAWYKVFQVCGGNAGALVRLARQVANNGGDWDAGLMVLWRAELARTEKLARGGEGWSSVQYAGIALQLLDAKYNVVPVKDALVLLGQQVVGKEGSTDESQEAAGQAVLQHLVQANALSVRPLSKWARDIPAEAYAGAVEVVTAPSSVNLYCMGRLRGQLEKAVQQWQQVGQAELGGNGSSSRPASPTSERLAAVERKMGMREARLEDVEEFISNEEQEIAKLPQEQPPGWQEERAFRQAKWQALVEEKRQLLEMLRQLQEEKLALMKREDREYVRD